MRFRRQNVWAAILGATAILFATGCSQMSSRMGSASDSTPTLTGAEEVPPVNTQASGVSRIAVIGDKTIIGTVEISNLNATAAISTKPPGGRTAR